MTALSLRLLWVIYRRTAVAQGTGASKRDLAVSQVAFYAGARGVLTVLDHMIATGDDDAVREAIKRFGRQIRAIQGLHPTGAAALRVSLPMITTPTAFILGAGASQPCGYRLGAPIELLLRSVEAEG